MIHSIEFKKDVKKGYIFNKKTKKVLRKNYKDWTPEQIESFIETEKKRTGSKFCLGRNPYDYFYYEVSDGYANPQLIKNLVGRKITFEKDKINVLFGPNGSGKTTIIKTIARYCLCGDTNNCDGYTNVARFEPLDFGLSFFSDKECDFNIENAINKYESYNRANVEWDGHPVYFENTSGRRDTGIFGDLTGGLFSTSSEEFLYVANRSRLSLGQNTIYMIQQLISAIERCPILDDFVNEVKKYEHNETWYKALTSQLNYIKSNYKEDGCMTLLLDEMDKSLDIENTLMLYRDFLPMLRNKYNIQIILVSHSPLMLSNVIQKSNDYNFISLDKKYTKEMKELFKGVTF
jgi:energy-coupling factor transporter ATP-binding protein EcfA2